MRVSYLEIYNEQCYDLLDISAQPSDIAIIEDSKDRIITKGLATPLVSSQAEALQYLFEVRTVAAKSRQRSMACVALLLAGTPTVCMMTRLGQSRRSLQLSAGYVSLHTK